MAIRKISEIGSSAIRTKAKNLIRPTGPKVQKLIADLADTMRAVNLVGIAAPQIGVGSCVFLTEVRKTRLRKDVSTLDPLRVFINPKILKRSRKLVEGYEGCGSVALGHLFGPVRRSESVTVKALDERGTVFTLEASGLLARIIQHEMDHLNGICFVDHVKDTRKYLGQGEYIKMRKKN